MYSLTSIVINVLKKCPVFAKFECTTPCERSFAVAANSGLISLFRLISLLKFRPLHLLKDIL
jgi:hypothetical protein